VSIRGFDHYAITVADIERTIAFYRGVLGCPILWEKEWRAGQMPIVTIQVGWNAINVHPASGPLEPHALRPTAGSADLCFRWDGPLEEAMELLRRNGVAIEIGPVPRPAADRVRGRSVYFRDPDGNLLELLSTDAPATAP
jgi:catechol 2,3-dioxygenase-like lactoylglutathione lyase family enzyme